MSADLDWAVALLKDPARPRVVEYDSEVDAKIAAETFHLWQTPLVVSRPKNPWTVEVNGRRITLEEASERLRNAKG